MITEQILDLELEPNQVHWISVKEILNSGLWFPGDYKFDCIKRCNYYAGTHYCLHREPMYYRWLRMFDKCREDKQYFRLRKELAKNGFKAPVGSKIGHNYDYIVTADGHHRITVAYDLDIDLVPVYVGSRTTKLDDLIAVDSQRWGQAINSPFFEEFDDAYQEAAA